MFNTHSADKETDKYLEEREKKKKKGVPNNIKNYKTNITHCIHHFCLQIYSKLAKQSKYIAFVEASVIIVPNIILYM